jgi:hypothetical protein
MMMGDTIPVNVTVLEIEPVLGRGRIAATAAVELEIAGIAIALRGFRIVRVAAPASYYVETPMCRDRSGRSVPAVWLPEELGQAVGDAVIDAFLAPGAQPVHHAGSPWKGYAQSDHV